MSRGKGRRRGTPGARDQVSDALQQWRAHTRDCHQCHANAGHPLGYCGAGWDLAQAVSRARSAARSAAAGRAASQGGLW